ncbi:hypothetical protein [Hyalangium gracile]|uniref:hypothetical protein n=1 Tax=Hyalangium gracile TaxID=394092 RepID=UPI001CCF5738|nr:hypothetical protein [Hyalangium gracile]
MTPRLLLLLPVLLLTSCGLFDEEEDCSRISCAPCPPALGVRLLVPGGAAAPEAVLEGVQGGCFQDEGLTVCNVTERRAGTFEFDIQATGYQKVHVREKVDEEERSGRCCVCGYKSRVVDVVLTPQ